MKSVQICVHFFMWIATLHQYHRVTGMGCQHLGSVDKSGTPEYHSGLIINVEDKATCEGTITSWQYCFNVFNTTSPTTNYSILVAAYRIQQFNQTYYNYSLVNQSQTLLQYESSEKINENGCTCISKELKENETFEIQEGDVMGACNLSPHQLIMEQDSDHVHRSIILTGNDQLCQSDYGQHLVGETSSSSLLLQARFRHSSNTVGLTAGLIVFFIVITMAAITGSLLVAFYCYFKIKHTASKKRGFKEYLLNFTPYKKQNNQFTLDRKPVKYKPATATMSRQAGTADSGLYATYLEQLYESPVNNPGERYEMDNAPNNGEYETPAANEDTLYHQLTTFSVNFIDPDQIRVVRYIGSGEFGNIRQGVFQLGAQSVDVALKTLKDTSSINNKVKFLQEAAIMAQFNHPNVIALHGLVNYDQTILVIEYADNGDLLSFLHKEKFRKSIECLQVLCLKFSREVAHGMLYLSRRGYIHRDLAARNVVLAGHTCKITDFGLSRELPTDDVYYKSSGGLIPLKWTALEALLKRKYSTASDVWSYGCVLYEIWSLGHKPFEDLANENVMKFLKYGYRLAPPPGCPLIIYKIMIDSWNPNPENRPTFCDVAIALNQTDSFLMNIPQEDLTGRAGELGAPLTEAIEMYLPLQKSYLN